MGFVPSELMGFVHRDIYGEVMGFNDFLWDFLWDDTGMILGWYWDDNNRISIDERKDTGC